MTPHPPALLRREHFQSVIDGMSTDLFTLANSKGMEVRFTRFENSRIVRAVHLNLLKGPAKVN